MPRHLEYKTRTNSLYLHKFVRLDAPRWPFPPHFSLEISTRCVPARTGSRGVERGRRGKVGSCAIALEAQAAIAPPAANDSDSATDTQPPNSNSTAMSARSNTCTTLTAFTAMSRPMNVFLDYGPGDADHRLVVAEHHTVRSPPPTGVGRGFPKRARAPSDTRSRLVGPTTLASRSYPLEPPIFTYVFSSASSIAASRGNSCNGRRVEGGPITPTL